MAIIAAFGDPPPTDAIEAAAATLRAGGIAGLPTDTVYGLAADPFHTGASDRLFAVKRRPRTVELPVLVADAEQAMSLAIAVPEAALRLMARCWPGPLTLILPRRPDLNADLGTDDATIGIRCPGHPVPRALCRAVGPVATTSANRHRQPPATTAAQVAALFGQSVELILDAGCCDEPPSTVVDCTGAEPRPLRDGPLSWAEVLEAAT